MRKIAISAGHSSKCQGMEDVINEVDEARRVCTAVTDYLFQNNIPFAGPFFDDISDDADECLQRICAWHNQQTRDIDVSIHFNSSNGRTSQPIGTECFYYSSNSAMKALADDVAEAIAGASGLIDRGPKTKSLYFLSHTAKPSVLVEICFGNSTEDCHLYDEYFSDICEALAQTLSDTSGAQPEPEPPEEVLFQTKGRCSWFGGPDDMGVSPDEELAWWDDPTDAAENPDLFLAQQPAGTTGLARRLDPDSFYVACRWAYEDTPKSMLATETKALVRGGGKEFEARPADWGPNESTGRVADLSPGLLEALGLTTDSEVEVIYPSTAAAQPEPEPERARIEITTSGPVDIIVNGIPIVDV